MLSCFAHCVGYGFFEANAETLKRSDYPSNSFVWPIVSPKMADALRSVGLLGIGEPTCR
jgi:hypothetical protein